VTLVNASGLYEKQGVLLRIRPDGSLTLVEMVNAKAKSDLNLGLYPFDKQRLEAVFGVLGFDTNEVVLAPLPDVAASDLGAIRMPQWDLMQVNTLIRKRQAPHTGSVDVASTFVLSLDVKRRPLFMVRLVIVPLILMSIFLTISFWVICASVVVNLVVGWFDRHGQAVLGDRIDQHCRWVFPAVYFGLILLSIGKGFILS
jgi:hypothetical protein